MLLPILISKGYTIRTQLEFWNKCESSWVTRYNPCLHYDRKSSNVGDFPTSAKHRLPIWVHEIWRQKSTQRKTNFEFLEFIYTFPLYISAEILKTGERKALPNPTSTDIVVCAAWRRFQFHFLIGREKKEDSDWLLANQTPPFFSRPIRKWNKKCLQAAHADRLNTL